MGWPARTAIGTLLLVGICLAIVGVGLSTTVAAQEDNATAGDEASFGAQVSSFMQSTAADTNGTVDRGMWQASLEDAENPGAAVRDRATQLERRLDSIERQTSELEDGPPGLVYTARASAVRVRLANLQQSIDETDEVATRYGVDDDRLAGLKNRAGSVRGPAVAAAARNVTDAGQGPPEWARGGPDGEPGPPNEAGNQGQGNETDGEERGPPGDRGNGGPPDDGGSDGPGGDGASTEGSGSSGGNSGSGGGPGGPPS